MIPIALLLNLQVKKKKKANSISSVYFSFISIEIYCWSIERQVQFKEKEHQRACGKVIIPAVYSKSLMAAHIQYQYKLTAAIQVQQVRLFPALTELCHLSTNSNQVRNLASFPWRHLIVLYAINFSSGINKDLISCQNLLSRATKLMTCFLKWMILP